MSANPVPSHFIRAWREHRGLTVEALADAIGMAKGNLSKIERGINPYTQHTIERMASALKCSAAELLARPPGEAPKLWMLYENASSADRNRLHAVAEALLSIQPIDAVDDIVGRLLKPAQQSPRAKLSESGQSQRTRRSK